MSTTQNKDEKTRIFVSPRSAAFIKEKKDERGEDIQLTKCKSTNPLK